MWSPTSDSEPILLGKNLGLRDPLQRPKCVDQQFVFIGVLRAADHHAIYL